MKKSHDMGSGSPEHSSDLRFLNRNYLSSPAHVHDLMKSCGWNVKITPRVVAAACNLSQPRLVSAALLKDTASFFRSNAVMVPVGLERIPICWLEKIAETLWSTRKPHWTKLPYFMSHCCFEEGVLAIQFTQEEPRNSEELGAWDRLRVILNFSVKPNIWTPLTQDQEREIWTMHPDLRRELLNVPDGQ